MRGAARMIQKFVRSKILRKWEADDRMAVFLQKNHQFLLGLRQVEQSILFNDNVHDQKTLDAYSKSTMFESGKRLGENIRGNLRSKPAFVPIKPTNDFKPRIKLFTCLIDFDCMVDTTDIYDQNWSVDF